MHTPNADVAETAPDIGVTRCAGYAIAEPKSAGQLDSVGPWRRNRLLGVQRPQALAVK